MTKKEVGHNFLARLGKKRLRPGGITATNWLIEQGQFSKDSHVLEVACNICTTSIELAQTYGCSIEGVDRDPKALEKARANICEAGLDELVHVQQANAMKLPFPDDSFDIIINEAKIKAIKEYLRVLKPGGRLLTHDVSFTEERMGEQLASLRQTINANVEPLHVANWQKLFEEQGFSSVKLNYGKMTLMSIPGMIKDEGFWGTLRITYRGLKKENRQQFLKMYRFFNKAGKDLTYIAVCSTK
ncbi:methyltransferase domain-containing protein [Streptococcus mutans]|uniref:class I SAM-dependent methyltransferase n=1 Tax=Streptococcus mutans TaxID=1309 RepID=UPI0002B53A76|nr:class I SAM-dependent methyltransferase [Streptococcus mutans]ARS62628.1 class I SAM-dependent methyltransferase [Streptococcus mutans]EMB98694.1 SAM-dependent methyltransferase [Streptococcus mutans T4]EMC50342.1 SAM-dependent methyltransferase [Streptococcus mutans SA41]ESS17269.1 putative methyltransferase [Streptococcus mutans PKUSS-LG01]ESS17580.1 putative methyltransferase [Streptococcus mutans PKUSS-HG01]